MTGPVRLDHVVIAVSDCDRSIAEVSKGDQALDRWHRGGSAS